MSSSNPLYGTAFTTDSKLLGPLSRKLQRAIDNKKYLDPGVSLASLSHDLVTNRTYLSDLIHQQYGISFAAFLNQLRIEEAKRMMEADKETLVCELYKKVGYSSLSAFYRNFKKQTGMTATEYLFQLYPELKEERGY